MLEIDKANVRRNCSVDWLEDTVRKNTIFLRTGLGRLSVRSYVVKILSMFSISMVQIFTVL